MKQNKIPKNEYIIQPKGKTNPYKDDVIYSDLGQWKYPGQVTRIPSNQITMQGVPYPVQGVDDTGYSQMMYPGMDYQFPGQYVTEYPMARYGGGLVKYQDRGQVEQKINSWLGEPMEKAREDAVGDRWYNPKTKQWEQEDEVDNFRHPMAGRYTAEAIANKFPDWMQYSGIPQAAGFIGANALGIGHEATSNKFVDPKGYKNYTGWEAIREAGEDIFNNAVGAGIGVLPMSDDQKTKILFNLSKNNQLPDGYGKGNMYFKPFGGQNTKTHTHMAQGGWLDTYDEGGEKPWSEMTPKERAVYLDNKETNKKAETKSRAQAKKEHINEYIINSTKEALTHPIFSAPAYFTPQGAMIGAGQSIINASKNIHDGNYKTAAFDALGVLPILKQLKNIPKIIKKVPIELPGSPNKKSISTNLEDLAYAKKWAKQYGYKLPKNLERIAKSDELTNKTIRGLMNRHNSFTRGISTNWDELGKKNPIVLEYLNDVGIDYVNNPKAAAEYMATHIPGETGYGRYGLKEGENALYLSNSNPTAEGYTYGQGYTVKVKKPTDFSSTNRKDWITNNEFFAKKGFKGSEYGTGIVKNDYIRRIPIGLRQTLAATGNPNKMSDLQKIVQGKEELYNDLAHQSWKKYNNLIDDLKYKTSAETRNKFLRWGDEGPEEGLRDVPNLFDKLQLKYLKNKKDLMQKYYHVLPLKDIVKGVYGDPDIWKALGKNMFGKLDPFSHYAIKGQPGEKVLEAIHFKEIKPELWNNKSRAHINLSSKGLTRRKNGGWLDTMQKGGISRDNTSVKKPNILNPTELANAQPYRKLSKEEQMPMYVDSAIANRQPDELRKTKKQGFGSKAHEVFMNPFTALTNLYQHGTLPDNFSQGETNALDFAVGAINPLTYLEAAYNTGKAAFDPETYKDLGKTVGLGVNALAGDQSPDEWKQAGFNTLFKGLDASMVKGAGKMIGKNAKRIINTNINKTSKNIKKGLDEQAGRYYQNAPGKGPVVNHPTGKMEGLASKKDIGEKYIVEGSGNTPYHYVPNAENPNAGVFKPMFGYKDWMHGASEVPSFNEKLNKMMTTASFGKRPLTTDIGIDREVSKNALMEALDNARYEEGITDLIPTQYMKKAKIPYNAKKAFQNIQPNKYGGLIMQKGGRTPIVVDDKNNPRLKAYNDSLALYNLSQKAKKLFDVDPSNDVLQGYNKKANDLASKSKIKPTKLQLSGYNQDYPKNFDPGAMQEPWMVTYKKPVQPYIYKKPEEKEQSRTDVYTDKALFDKAYKAEMDSINVRKTADQTFKPGNKTRPLTNKEKEEWKDEKTGLYPNVVEYNSGQKYFGHFKKPVVHNVYQPPPPPEEEEPIKDTIPYKPKPKSIKSDTTRQWNFNGINPIMEYFDGSHKIIGKDYYKDMDAFKKGEKTKPLTKEYKRGGQKGLKKYTSKNIATSVNDIMLRNETLFGPAGKKRYKPGLKYKSGGGWLDNLT